MFTISKYFHHLFYFLYSLSMLLLLEKVKIVYIRGFALPFKCLASGPQLILKEVQAVWAWWQQIDVQQITVCVFPSFPMLNFRFTQKEELKMSISHACQWHFIVGNNVASSILRQKKPSVEANRINTISLLCVLFLEKSITQSRLLEKKIMYRPIVLLFDWSFPVTVLYRFIDLI